MENQEDNISQTKLNINSTSNGEETTNLIQSLEVNNETIDNDWKHGVEVTEIYCNVQDWIDIDKLIYAGEFENIDRRIYAQQLIIYPNDATPDLHDETYRIIDLTSTGGINISQLFIRCVKMKPSEDRRLPDGIFKLFPYYTQQEVITIMKIIQDEREKIWVEIDKKYGKSQMTSAAMYNKFKEVFQSYLCKEFPRLVQPINDAQLMLEQLSFGITLYTMEGEIFVVQNRHGSWSAMKGHPKIKDDRTLETPWETSVRELLEELSIILKQSKREKEINEKNIQLLIPDKTNFLECYLDSKPNTNDRLRRIGLFYVCIDKKKWKFSLKDNTENQRCRWLKMNDIIRNKPENGRDIYYTLRPFVLYIQYLLSSNENK